MTKPLITPFLWFDHQAEEAANFYVSIFPNSKIHKITRYGAAGPAPAGTVMTVDFELDGRRLIAFNGGPHFQLNEAFSFVVECATQQEVDAYWEKLTAGGSEVQCGWLKDQFGVSWQIVPSEFLKLANDPDPQKAGRVMQAMLSMKKLDMAALQRAYDGD